MSARPPSPLEAALAAHLRTAAPAFTPIRHGSSAGDAVLALVENELRLYALGRTLFRRLKIGAELQRIPVADVTRCEVQTQAQCHLTLHLRAGPPLRWEVDGDEPWRAAQLQQQITAAIALPRRHWLAEEYQQRAERAARARTFLHQSHPAGGSGELRLVYQAPAQAQADPAQLRERAGLVFATHWVHGSHDGDESHFMEIIHPGGTTSVCLDPTDVVTPGSRVRVTYLLDPALPFGSTNHTPGRTLEVWSTPDAPLATADAILWHDQAAFALGAATQSPASQELVETLLQRYPLLFATPVGEFRPLRIIANGDPLPALATPPIVEETLILSVETTYPGMRTDPSEDIVLQVSPAGQVTRWPAEAPGLRAGDRLRTEYQTTPAGHRHPVQAWAASPLA